MYEMEQNKNSVVQPLLIDLYQITMSYAYWKSGKMNEKATFNLFFRRNPFNGEFTIFAGLGECVKLLQEFHFCNSDIDYLKTVLPPDIEPDFFEYLLSITADDISLSAIDEGTVVFPRVPLIVVEGSLVVTQLLETLLLNLINYASLVATNAMRFRIAAGSTKTLLEFGLRRAQGPDGGLSASRYCYLGGFDGTSNVLAGKMFGIPVRGTHAHAFITSYCSISDLLSKMLKKNGDQMMVNFVDICLEWQTKLSSVLFFQADQTNEGELAAFIAYAQAFPTSMIALIDTYDVIKSGLPNFCSLAMALDACGYRALGIRLDSGDLAYLSFVVRQAFETIAERFHLPWFASLSIIASNDINEDTIHSLNTQGHCIDCFGIGTHLVTCQKQPALGCVYKLVDLEGRATMKLSEDVEKVTIPGKKQVFRFYSTDGTALVDLITLAEEEPPSVGDRVLCRHPIQESKRAYVKPAAVQQLLHEYWSKGMVMRDLPSVSELRMRAFHSLRTIRQDHKRALNPTPYKVSVSTKMYTFIHDLWLQSAPIRELF